MNSQRHSAVINRRAPTDRDRHIQFRTDFILTCSGGREVILCSKVKCSANLVKAPAEGVPPVMGMGPDDVMGLVNLPI